MVARVAASRDCNNKYSYDGGGNCDGLDVSHVGPLVELTRTSHGKMFIGGVSSHEALLT